MLPLANRNWTCQWEHAEDPWKAAGPHNTLENVLVDIFNLYLSQVSILTFFRMKTKILEASCLSDYSEESLQENGHVPHPDHCTVPDILHTDQTGPLRMLLAQKCTQPS